MIKVRSLFLYTQWWLISLYFSSRCHKHTHVSSIFWPFYFLGWVASHSVHYTDLMTHFQGFHLFFTPFLFLFLNRELNKNIYQQNCLFIVRMYRHRNYTRKSTKVVRDLLRAVTSCIQEVMNRRLITWRGFSGKKCMF